MTSQAHRCRVLVVAAFLCGGCSSEIDYDDELGLEGSPSEDYELVVISGGERVSPSEDGSSDDEGGRIAPVDQQSELIVYDDEGEFTVQVGLFDTARRASERVKELSANGYPAYVITVPGGGRFRVRIGYFESRDMAQRFGGIFKEDTGVEFWIDRRSNEMY